MTNKIRQTENINFERPTIPGIRPIKAKNADTRVRNKNAITSLIIKSSLYFDYGPYLSQTLVS